jgi:hypothetical protein
MNAAQLGWEKANPNAAAKAKNGKNLAVNRLTIILCSLAL